MLACFCGMASIVQILLHHGADYNARARDGQTPVSIAALMGHSKIIRLFIQHGANVLLTKDTVKSCSMTMVPVT
jgi:ankyrin